MQALDAVGDRAPVREQAAEPAVVHVRHADALRVALDRVLRLLLRADEQHGAAALGDVAGEVVGLLDELERLLEVDDVDPAPLGEDEAPHLRVPAAGLVAEMDSGLQELSHADDGHGQLPLSVLVGDVTGGSRWNRPQRPAPPPGLVPPGRRDGVRASMVPMLRRDGPADGDPGVLAAIGEAIRASAWDLGVEIVEEGLRDDTLPSLSRLGRLGQLGDLPTFIAELARELAEPATERIRRGSPLVGARPRPRALARGPRLLAARDRDRVPAPAARALALPRRRRRGAGDAADVLDVEARLNDTDRPARRGVRRRVLRPRDLGARLPRAPRRAHRAARTTRPSRGSSSSSWSAPRRYCARARARVRRPRPLQAASTTRSATSRATACSRASPGCCSRSGGRPTSRAGWAATSSRCC